MENSTTQKPFPVGYLERVQRIERHYCQLNRTANKILYPPERNPLQRSHSKKISSPVLEWLYWPASPYPSGFNLDQWKIWSMTCIVWLAVAFGCLEVLGALQNGSGPSLLIGLTAGHPVGQGFLPVAALFSVLSLVQWVGFCFDSDVPIWLRLLWVVLVLPRFFLAAWSFGQSHGGSSWASFAGLYWIYVFPLGTFLGFWALEITGWLIQLAGTLFGQVFSSHVAYFGPAILQLAQASIGDEVEGWWRLADLCKEDLDTLSAWASANREATDRRLVPTAVVSGALSVVAGSSALSGLLEKWILQIGFWPFIQLPHPESVRIDLGQFLWMPITLFLTLFVVHLGKLFLNLFVQNLVIETCLLVGYGQVEAVRVSDRTQSTVEYPSASQKAHGDAEILRGIQKSSPPGKSKCQNSSFLPPAQTAHSREPNSSHNERKKTRH
jgi:hypothetical protein